ncbi:DUF1624 domain-containing protein [Exilibacterium tricleocarpae]|uniref:DUF1624 domain-containing protein n=1 Tax=Exilibacterium tricleocarpae TaxID=2591008 RepID=A0A545U5I2_9GAMM|nr:heparan-alpha-glucosaminide N-acetyltransferase domain-containing protein [Exilibacterium tricleocarpae]TQV84722.1 DUF1624 domain-containing protein [Exilibacterium tricleocarpae]
MSVDADRILAVDLARGLSVVLMVTVHTLWMYADVETQTESLLGTAVHMIGKGTPVFLVAMGISFMLSRDQSVAGAVRRGIGVLALGYAMNTLKFLVPISVFGTMPPEFAAAYGWDFPLTSGQLLYLVLTGDILQLAGLSLIVLAVVRHYVKNKYGLLAGAVVVMFSARLAGAVENDNAVLDYVLRLFWSESYQVYFPVFPWLAFILLGMFLGAWFGEQRRRYGHVFGGMLPLGAGFAVLGGALCLWNADYHFGNFFHLGPGGALYLAGLNLMGLWAIHRLAEAVGPNRLFDCLCYCSKRVTSLYVIQWVLICWGMGWLGYQQLQAAGVLALMPVMLVLTLLVQSLREHKLVIRKTGIQ